MTTITHDETTVAAATLEPKVKRTLPRWLKALLRNPVSIAGRVLVVCFALVAIFAPVLAPYQAHVLQVTGG